MQMYEVSFQTHYEDMIDVGKALVCAADNEKACEMVRLLLGLPGSQTVFSATRVKPSLYQIDRKEILKHAVARSNNKPMAPLDNYVLSVTCGVRAAGEGHAWRKLGQTLIARAASEKAQTDRSITELEVKAERLALCPRNGAIAKQAIYKETRFYQGGATRPR